MNIFNRWCLAAMAFLCFLQVNAQKQNNTWYFGDHAGLNFNSGAPVALTNGQLFSNEGSSSVSDNAGNLLFYTNGVSIWNRLHAVMPNGSGLLGDVSSSQSAIIVQNPGNLNQYYVFTLPPTGNTNGMRYSIVDMTLGGGNGAVVASAKNIMLHTSSTEKVAAYLNCDGSIWLVSHGWNSNAFYADLITASGISPSVVSNVGVVHTGGTAGPNFNAVGCMKISLQGNRLALAIRDMHLFELFDFNTTTGVVSNPVTLSSTTYNVPYGVEFSPDGSKLYGTTAGSVAVYQFNITLPTAAAIMGSAINVAGPGSGLLVALQLGPDNKMYVAREFSYTSGPSSVDVINNPNVNGTGCGYVTGAVSLAGKICLAGLPTTVVIPQVDVHISGPTIICAGQSITLTGSGANSYVWSGGVSATTASVTVSPTVTTDYYLSDACGHDTDTITVVVDTPITINVTGPDTICAGQSAILSATGSVQYQWSSSPSVLSSITETPSVTTTYYVSGMANTCAADTDTLTVYVETVPSVSVTGITSVCTGQSATLTASGATGYAWAGGSTATTAAITVAPTVTTAYYVTGTAVCGSDSDTITVQVDSPVNITVTSSDDSLCLGETTTLTATGGTAYQWSGMASTSASVNVSPAITTTYYVSGAANACATDTDTLTIYVDSIPSISVTGATGICIGLSTTLTASGSNNYTWSGGSTATTASITVSPIVATTYYVTATSLYCGSDTDTVTVTVDTVSTIIVTGTDTICAGQSVTLTASGGDTYLWSTMQTTPAITVTPATTTTYSVTGSNGGCAAVVSTHEVVVSPLPVVAVTGVPYICAGSSGTYTAAVTGGILPFQYNWGSGNTGPAITITPVNTSTVLNVSVTDAAGCSNSSSFTVTTVPRPVAIVTATGSGCVPLNMNFFSEATNATSFEWHFGDGTVSNQQSPSHIFSNSGYYTVTLITTNAAGCTDTLVLDSAVAAYAKPIAGISSTGNITTDHTLLTLYNHSQNADDCMLYYGDGTTLVGCNWSDAFHTYEQEGDYTVTQIVTTENGCADTAALFINATYESTFFAPNAITANGNAHNDIFYIYGTGLFAFHLTIYNRWGEQIYDSHDQYEGWDGTYRGRPVEAGVYVWKVDYRTKRLGGEQKIGHVTVIR